MTGDLAWATRPKWRRLESARSYTRRQCAAAGIPLEHAERGLASRTGARPGRAWADQAAAAALVEAAAGRPPGHCRRLEALAQPEPGLHRPRRFLCRLCAAGQTVEQIRHDRENWCLRHPGQMVWAGPGTTPRTQHVVPYDRGQARAERRFRRLAAAGRITARLHARAWDMVRDNARLSRPAAPAGGTTPEGEAANRANLYPQTVAVLEALSDPATIRRWRAQDPALLRGDIASTLPPADGPARILVERIVLWLRPLRRAAVPTRVDPLNVPMDAVDAAAVIDTAAGYPAWIRRHPQAAAEWDFDRNDPARDPWGTVGVSKKACWVCDQGHTWEATPTARGATRSRCPYCAGQDVWPGHTDLATLHPDLAAQWDTAPGANTADPGHVAARSSRRAAWECPHGHRWTAPVGNRSRLGSGCPYCTGRRPIPGRTDLATLRPDLAAQWDTARNGADAAPHTVGPGSGRKAWWKCPRGHSWQATVGSRSRPDGNGCPYCANKAVLPGYNDLATTRPDLAAEWDIVTRTPRGVTAGSNYRATWKCAAGHSWQAAVASRTAKRATGCPYCASRAVLPGYNDLATTRPDLAAEWDTTAGVNDRTPSGVTSKSRHTAAWRCREGHAWRASVANRAAGSGCPYCAGQRAIPGQTDLATLRPDLAAQWDTDNDTTPDQVMPSTHRKATWRCAEGHTWQATVANRTAGHGCPYCAGQRPIPRKTDLATRRPDLAAQWAAENTLAPGQVSVASNRRVAWTCTEGHTWQAVIASRTRPRGTGCPYCARTKPRTPTTGRPTPDADATPRGTPAGARHK